MQSISDIAASAGNLLIEVVKAPFKFIGYCFGRVVEGISSVINYLSGRSDDTEQNQVTGKTLSSRTVSTGSASTAKVATEKIKDEELEELKNKATKCLVAYLKLINELVPKMHPIIEAKNLISRHLSVDPKDLTKVKIDAGIKILKDTNRNLGLRYSDEFFNIPPDSQSGNAKYKKILIEFQNHLNALTQAQTKRTDEYKLIDSLNPVKSLQEEFNRLIHTNCPDKDQWQRCGERLKQQFASDEPYLRKLCDFKYVPQPGEKTPAADLGHIIELDGDLKILFRMIDGLQGAVLQ